MKKTILGALLLVSINTFAVVQIKTFSGVGTVNIWIKENEKDIDVIAIRPYSTRNGWTRFMVEYYDSKEN